MEPFNNFFTGFYYFVIDESYYCEAFSFKNVFVLLIILFYFYQGYEYFHQLQLPFY